MSQKYCFNDSEDSCDVYGGLFEWWEMMQYETNEGAQGICPLGWHLPTLAEWNTLITYIGPPNESKKLQALGNNCINDGCEDLGESSFDALLAGHRYWNGSFYGNGSVADFWTSSPNPGDYPYAYFRMKYDSPNMFQWGIYGSRGFAVRCLKD